MARKTKQAVDTIPPISKLRELDNSSLMTVALDSIQLLNDESAHPLRALYDPEERKRRDQELEEMAKDVEASRLTIAQQCAENRRRRLEKEAEEKRKGMVTK